MKALNTDLNWLREGTRYLQRATEWDAGGRATNRLLSGSDVTAARVWTQRRPSRAPQPTELQLDYIKASEAEEVRRQTAEAERLRQVAEAQEAREAALADKEKALVGESAAQKLATEQAKRVVSRTRIGAGAASILAALSIGFAYFAYQQREAAVDAKGRVFDTLKEISVVINNVQNSVINLNKLNQIATSAMCPGGAHGVPSPVSKGMTDIIDQVSALLNQTNAQANSMLEKNAPQ